MSRDRRVIALALGIFALITSGVFLYGTNLTSGSTNNEKFHREKFHQRVRNALAELNFSPGKSQDNINDSTNKLAKFINYRSGIKLSKETKDLLSSKEKKSQTESKRITQTQLAEALTTVAFEKLAVLSDSDIDAMADNLRGFKTPGVSDADSDFRGFVKLRANGEGMMEPADFVKRLKNARADEIDYQNQTGAAANVKSPLYRRTLRDRLNTEITNRANYLAASSPDFFNGSTNNDLTPTQALLLTYSIVTNDSLAGNQTDLQLKMEENQRIIVQHLKRPFPSPQNQHAYGVNGYMFSTPSDLLLDDAAITRVLNLAGEEEGL
jgi:hypothetical protein